MSFFLKFSSEVEKCIMWGSSHVFPNQVKSVQLTLSYLITTSAPRVMFTHFFVEHGLSQYYLYLIDLPGGRIT